MRPNQARFFHSSSFTSESHPFLIISPVTATLFVPAQTAALGVLSLSRFSSPAPC
jgi:hypothetical protein